MKILSHFFYEKNKDSWERLESLNEKLNRRGYRAMEEQELQDFPLLYRKVCSDLAEARLKRLAPDLMAYLNHIAANSHSLLYGGRKNVREPGMIRRGIAEFVKRILPRTLVARKKILLLSCLFFFGSYGISAYLVSRDPSSARVIVQPEILEMMEESYSAPMDQGRGGGVNSSMFTYYIQHNVSIAFISFASGIFLGLGTFYFLIYNGMQLGTISGYLFALGYGGNFITFVTAHSIFELSGLVLAGAAGLLLGQTVLAPGNLSRKRAFRKIKLDLLSLVGAAAILITCAAVIEGYVSPQPIPYVFKLSLFLLSLLLEIFYLGYVFLRFGRRS